MRAYLDFVNGTLILGATLVVALLLVAVIQALPVGGELLDEKVGYTHEEAVAAMEGYGEKGRQTYAWSAADAGHAVAPRPTPAFWQAPSTACDLTERSWRLAWLPLAAGALDLCENVQIILMLTGYPDVSAGQIASASLFTTLKSYALLLSMALAVALAIAAAVRTQPPGARPGSIGSSPA